MQTQKFIFIGIVLVLLVALPAGAFEGPQLYPGEKALYEAAAQEGMVVSFDTGPTWANSFVPACRVLRLNRRLPFVVLPTWWEKAHRTTWNR